MAIRTRILNEEVLYSDDLTVKVDIKDIGFLKEQALHTKRKRIRLCSHVNEEDTVHEMLIIHFKNTYVRPHKHMGKSESFHLIEGDVDVVIFDEAGNIKDVIEMGEYSSGKKFYYRITEPLYHTLVIKSDVLVFHETTRGPFNRSNTVFAPWSPDESNDQETNRFIDQLSERVHEYHKNY
ncbi:MAG: WbuC family cupin fold metalloprotein [Candidatus Brocadiaceae bacterium]|nr:WbuC family cupin fold metalloprotein [Candidatus Brocadiaceae bacterium]